MTHAATILIVDDEKNTADGLAQFLSAHDYEVFIAYSGEEALEKVAEIMPDVILSDLRMGTALSGMDLLDAVIQKKVATAVIMMTAYGTVENAVEAMHRGAYHYITKPVNLDELLIVIKKALARTRLEKENKELKAQLRHVAHTDLIVGTSDSFRRVYDEAVQVANSTASVLIQGESGTGKELIAELIHRESARRDFPFVPVQCAALSENLLESELFGHEKGAFTGATERKIGRFEKAHKGTIFLDEIGEIDQRTQVKLLRVLQEGKFERVGGTKTISADIRLIAATNKDLFQEVKKGAFREDLYYRIKVIVLQVPPLRQRQNDIRELFDYYVKKFSYENNKTISHIESTVYGLLEKYEWPGNIRELKNVAERIVVLLKSSEITVADIPHDIRFSQTTETAEEVITVANGTISDIERETIRRKLTDCGGNKTKVAKALGISRRTLYRKIEEYGLAEV